MNRILNAVSKSDIEDQDYEKARDIFKQLYLNFSNYKKNVK